MCNLYWLTPDKVPVDAEDEEGEGGREETQVYDAREGQQNTQEDSHTAGSAESPGNGMKEQWKPF